VALVFGRIFTVENFKSIALFVVVVYGVLLFALPFMVFACQRYLHGCLAELKRIRRAVESRKPKQVAPPPQRQPSARMLEKVAAADARRAAQ